MFEWLQSLFGGGQQASPQLMFDPANGGAIGAMPQHQPMQPQPPVQAPPPLPPERPGVGVLNTLGDQQQQPQMGVMDAGTPNPMQAGPLMAYLAQQYKGMA